MTSCASEIALSADEEDHNSEPYRQWRRVLFFHARCPRLGLAHGLKCKDSVLLSEWGPLTGWSPLITPRRNHCSFSRGWNESWRPAGIWMRIVPTKWAKWMYLNTRSSVAVWVVGGETLLEEAHRWLWALKLYSLTSCSLPLFSECEWECDQPAFHSRRHAISACCCVLPTVKNCIHLKLWTKINLFLF